MVDLIELYVHWHAGRSKSALADSLGIDRGAIRKYLAPAEAEGLVPGGEPLSEQEWRAKVAEWFPNVVDARLRQITWPEIAVHRDYIVEQLKAEVTRATIHQRLRDELGLQAGLTSLKRWIEATTSRCASSPRSKPTTSTNSSPTAPPTTAPWRSRATGCAGSLLEVTPGPGLMRRGRPMDDRASCRLGCRI
jgi:hypothetical protein